MGLFIDIVSGKFGLRHVADIPVRNFITEDRILILLDYYLLTTWTALELWGLEGMGCVIRQFYLL